MGCYINPDDDSTLEDVAAAISRRPCGDELMVVGNFNANLEKPEGITCTEDIKMDLAAAGLKDYPPLAEETPEAGIKEVETYVAYL